MEALRPLGSFGHVTPRFDASTRLALSDDPARVFAAVTVRGVVEVRSISATGEVRTLNAAACDAGERCTRLEVSPDGARAALWFSRRKSAARLVLAPLDGAPPRRVDDAWPPHREGVFLGRGEHLLLCRGDSWILADGDGRALRAFTVHSRIVVAAPDGVTTAFLGTYRGDRRCDLVVRPDGATLASTTPGWVHRAAFSRDGAALWTIRREDVGAGSLLCRWDLARDTHASTTLEGFWRTLHAGSGDAVTLSDGGLGTLRARWSAARGAIELSPPSAARWGRDSPPSHRRATAFAASPDGARGVALVSGRPVAIDLATGALGTHDPQASGAVTALRPTPDGRLLALGMEDGSLRVVEVATGDTQMRFEGHTDVVRACLWSLDRREVCSIARDKTLRRWDLATGREVARHALPATPHRRTQPVMTPDGDAVVLELSDGYGECHLRRGIRSTPIMNVEGPGVVRVLRADVDATVFFSAQPVPNHMGDAWLYVARTRRSDGRWAFDELPGRLRATPGIERATYARSEDGALVLCVTPLHHPGAWLWDCAASRLVWRAPDPPPGSPDAPLGCVAVGRRRIVEGRGDRLPDTDGDDGTALTVWDTATRARRATVALPLGERVTALALSADESEAFVGTKHGRLLRYRLP